MQRGKRTLQFRIIPARVSVNLAAVGQDGRRGGHGLEVGARIGKQEYAKLQAGAGGCEPGILHVADSLLLLQFGLDDVGVGGLAGLLALLGELEKVAGLVRTALHDGKLGFRGSHAIVERYDRGEQAAPRDLRLGCGLDCMGVRHGDCAELLETERLVDDGLAGVLMHGVVGDEARSR